MTINKTCPQCDTAFEGRSNQLYCSSLCKQRAFHEGKTRAAQQEPPRKTTATTFDIPPLSAKYEPTTEIGRQLAKLDEAARLQGLERLRRTELEAQRQEQAFALQKEEREFARERERAVWDLEALKVKHAPTTLPAPPSQETDLRENDKTEDDAGGLSAGQVALLGLAGLLLGRLLTAKPKEPIPANTKLPPTKPQTIK